MIQTNVLGGRRSYAGALVGFAFCVVATVNSLRVASYLATPGDQRAARLALILAAGTAAITIAVHIFMWSVYAALVGIFSRFWLAGQGRFVSYKSLFVSVGHAQLPLLLWAIGFGMALSFLNLETGEVTPALRVQMGLRTVAYLCGLVMFTGCLVKEQHVRVRTAVLLAWLPALFLIVLINIVELVFRGLTLG